MVERRPTVLLFRPYDWCAWRELLAAWRKAQAACSSVGTTPRTEVGLAALQACLGRTRSPPTVDSASTWLFLHFNVGLVLQDNTRDDSVALWYASFAIRGMPSSFCCLLSITTRDVIFIQLRHHHTTHHGNRLQKTNMKMPFNLSAVIFAPKTRLVHCVWKKLHPFCFCNNLCRLISIFFGTVTHE